MRAPGRERRRAREEDGKKKALGGKLPGPDKVADRPHLLTILVGIFSPTLAIVAAAISFGAYQVSDLSMKIAQKAYLRVENSRFSLTRLDTRYKVVEAEVGGRVQDVLLPSVEPAYRIPLSFEVHNSGNTPANLRELKLRLIVPDGFEKPTKGMDPETWKYKATGDKGRYILVLNNLGAVPARGYVKRTIAIEGDARRDSFEGNFFLKVHADLFFDDVFGTSITVLQK